MSISAPPRGRLPRPERRAQLLAAALSVFVSAGYHAAGMADIATAAGVSKPVLYQHFPSKLALYLAILDANTDELIRRMRSAVASTSDNELRVHNAVSAYFDFVDDEADAPSAFRLVFESDLRGQPAVRDRLERSSRLCAQAFAETIATDTGLPHERAELLGVALSGLSERAAGYWLATKRSIPKAEAVRLTETLAWGGISDFPLQTAPH